MRVVRHHSGNEYAVGDIDEVVMMRVVTSESPLLMIVLLMIMLLMTMLLMIVLLKLMKHLEERLDAVVGEDQGGEPLRLGRGLN